MFGEQQAEKPLQNYRTRGWGAPVTAGGSFPQPGMPSALLPARDQ